MTKRKTVDVEVLKNMVNDMCRFSIDNQKGIRQGAMNVLEAVLHETGNYKGFRYLGPDEMESGYSAGINSDMGKFMEYEARFANTDNTRVCYN